tara:strand:- start:53380 stop:55008 length:1629 start_codon:yes stop_codon:yes gene_type:complete
MEKNKKNKVIREDLKRARAIAFALEKSFTSPMPDDAMAPAPLIDEILELGDAGIRGMQEHLNLTSDKGVLPTLLAIKTLNNTEFIPSLLELAMSFKWTPEQLKLLKETILSIDSDSIIPDVLSDQNLEEISKNIDLFLNHNDLNKVKTNDLEESIGKLSIHSQSLIFRQILNQGEPKSIEKLFRIFENVFEKTQQFSPDLINLVVSLSSNDAAIFLVNMSENSLDKKFKSLLRKSIFRLEKKGINVKNKTSKDESLPSNLFQENDISKAICSSTDGTGRKILWIIRSKKPKGRYLGEFNLKVKSGIEDLSLVETTSKEIRNFLSKIEEQDSLATAEVPISYANWLLERAQLENEKLGITLPSGFTRTKLLLNTLVEKSEFSDMNIHPVAELMNNVSKDKERIDASILLSDKVFSGWYIDDQIIRPYVQTYIDSLNSDKKISEQKRNELLERTIKTATSEIYKNKNYIRRLTSQLEENAYLYHHLGMKDFSRECFMLSTELSSDELTSSFFLEMVRSTLLAWSKSLNEQKENAKKESEDQTQQ